MARGFEPGNLVDRNHGFMLKTTEIKTTDLSLWFKEHMRPRYTLKSMFTFTMITVSFE